MVFHSVVLCCALNTQLECAHVCIHISGVTSCFVGANISLLLANNPWLQKVQWLFVMFRLPHYICTVYIYTLCGISMTNDFCCLMNT